MWVIESLSYRGERGTELIFELMVRKFSGICLTTLYLGNWKVLEFLRIHSWKYHAKNLELPPREISAANPSRIAGFCPQNLKVTHCAQGIIAWMGIITHKPAIHHHSGSCFHPPIYGHISCLLCAWGMKKVMSLPRRFNLHRTEFGIHLQSTH